MTSVVNPFPNLHASATALTVYNLPQVAGEQDIRSIFPSVKYVNMTNRPSNTGGSQGVCVLHFDNPRDCQKVYAECQSGKTVGGRMIHAEFSSSWNPGGTELPSAYQNSEAPRRSKPKPTSTDDEYQYSDNSQYYSGQNTTESSKYGQSSQRSHGSYDSENSSRRQSDSDGHSRYQQSGRYDQSKPSYSATAVSQPHQQTKQYGGAGGSGSGCTLTVSNLPYSATEADIKREFVNAFRVILNLNEQGQSRGVAQVTFSTPEQCNAALQACNDKTMSGRTLRGRIQRDNEGGSSQYTQRDNSSRDHSTGRRDFGNNQRSYGEGQRDNNGGRGDYSGVQRGGYGNNQRDYAGNRDFGGRGGGGNQYRDFGNRRGGNFERGGRMNDYNSGRGDRDNRFSGGNGAGTSRYGQRESFDDANSRRRERSPNRGEPVRGYGGGKGPRITSAVIRGHEESSSSGSSSEEN